MPRNPANLCDDAAGQPVVEKPHGADVVGELQVDHVEHYLWLLGDLLTPLVHGHLAHGSLPHVLHLSTTLIKFS